MFVSNTHLTGQSIFDGKSQTVQDLYAFLVEELHKLGPVRDIKKSISISFENRKPFASALIRNRSIKLILRTQRRITNERILYVDRIDNRNFDHTLVLDSKSDIDAELMIWLGEAYQHSQ